MTFADNRYVYAVVSRRSKGVSIGINLNPDKVCNFDCVYCQVDRKTPPLVRDVDVPRSCEELDDMLDRSRSGELFEHERFRADAAGAAPPERHRLLRRRRTDDLSGVSGGRPRRWPKSSRQRGLDAVKLVLITNATMLHHPAVRQVLAVLDANNGEIWAKLDAGTEAYYRQMDRTTIPFRASCVTSPRRPESGRW